MEPDAAMAVALVEKVVVVELSVDDAVVVADGVVVAASAVVVVAVVGVGYLFETSVEAVVAL